MWLQAISLSSQRWEKSVDFFAGKKVPLDFVYFSALFRHWTECHREASLNIASYFRGVFFQLSCFSHIDQRVFFSSVVASSTKTYFGTNRRKHRQEEWKSCIRSNNAKKEKSLSFKIKKKPSHTKHDGDEYKASCSVVFNAMDFSTHKSPRVFVCGMYVHLMLSRWILIEWAVFSHTRN